MQITREAFEQLVNQFALSIQKSKGFKCNPSDFKFLVEESMLNSVMITAGNPVIIHVRLHDVAEALTQKGRKLIEFKHLIENCLTVVPRMLHTLSLVPVSQILIWNEEIRKFKKHAGLDTELLPKLLPDSEIHYDIRLRIRAVHILSDTKIVVSDTKLDIEKLKRLARETLSEEVFANVR